MKQQNQKLTHVKHEFDPIFDENSEILILGTLPSVKSREQNFYYGHPQNRFWKVIAALTNRPLPQTIEEKKRLLLENRIAVWDVIANARSLDPVTAASETPCRMICIKFWMRRDSAYLYERWNSKTSYEKFQKDLAVPMTGLPSTSPANAAFTMDRLLEKWKVISPYFHCESPRDPK